MCKFGGNCHKQFGTNYLYVQSGYRLFVRTLIFLYVYVSLSLSLCKFECLKVNFRKEHKGTRNIKVFAAVGVIVHHLTERELIIVLTLYMCVRVCYERAWTEIRPEQTNFFYRQF